MAGSEILYNHLLLSRENISNIRFFLNITVKWWLCIMGHQSTGTVLVLFVYFLWLLLPNIITLQESMVNLFKITVSFVVLGVFLSLLLCFAVVVGVSTPIASAFVWLATRVFIVWFHCWRLRGCCVGFACGPGACCLCLKLFVYMYPVLWLFSPSCWGSLVCVCFALAFDPKRSWEKFFFAIECFR